MRKSSSAALLSCVSFSGQGKVHHTLFSAFLEMNTHFCWQGTAGFIGSPLLTASVVANTTSETPKIAIYLFSLPALIPISCLFHTLEGPADFPGLIQSLQGSDFEDFSGVCAQCKGRLGRRFAFTCSCYCRSPAAEHSFSPKFLGSKDASGTFPRATEVPQPGLVNIP